MGMLKTIKPLMVKHEPEILMSMGLVGLVSSIFLAANATAKATKVVEEERYRLNKEKLTKTEIIKAVWKLYIPTAVLTVVSVPCVIAGNRVSSKRNAALAAAYTLSETALEEYQNKTKEIVGEKKEKEIRDSVSQDKVNKDYKPSSVLLTNGGDSLFKDELSGRYFKSSWNAIQKAANELNQKAIAGSDITTVNDWFEALGLEPIDGMDHLGWRVYDGRGLIQIELGSCLTPDNIPCGCIQYTNQPRDLSMY